MAKTPGLIQRGGTYYYRVRVPKDLVEVLGKQEIRKSLGTKNHSEAKKQRNIVAVACDAMFDKARTKIAQTQKSQTKLTRSEALALARDHFVKLDNKFQKFDEQRDYSDSERASVILDEQISAEIHEVQDHPDTLSSTQRTARELLAGRNIELNVADGIHLLLLEYLRRASLELSRRDIARLKQDY